LFPPFYWAGGGVHHTPGVFWGGFLGGGVGGGGGVGAKGWGSESGGVGCNPWK
jgi:hypothetical protein